MKKFLTRSLLIAALAAGSAFMFTACGDDSDSSSQSETKEEINYDELKAEVPGFEDNYVLTQLSGDLLENFLVYNDAIVNRKEEFDFPHPISPDDNEQLITLAMLLGYETPQNFYYNDDFEVFTYGDDENYAGANLSYIYDQDTYDSYLAQCKEVADKLVSETEGMSDYDKELYIYDYLAKNIQYDDTTDECGTIYGALVLGRAKCSGISKAFRWVCEQAGLKCQTAFCYKDDVNFEDGHAWNVIKIAGNWYDVDLTQDCAKDDREYDGLYYSAFNVPRTWITDAEAPLSHLYADYVSLPESTSYDLDYHVVNNSFVSAGTDYTAMFHDAIVNAYAEGNNVIHLQFESDDDYNNFHENYEDTYYDWYMNESPDELQVYDASLYSQAEFRTVAFVPQFGNND